MVKRVILVHFEFFGSDEESKIMDKAFIEMANEIEGLEFEEKLIPMQGRYHYTYLFRAEGLHAWEEGVEKLQYQRDKSKLTRMSVEPYRVV